MTMTTTSRVSAYAPIIAKAEKFNNDMTHLFASVSEYSVEIEYNTHMVAFFDKSKKILYIWDASFSGNKEVSNLRLMFESMGFRAWIDLDNLLDVSGNGCNEEFNVEKMLNPIEAFLLYLERYNFTYKITKFDDNLFPVK